MELPAFVVYLGNGIYLDSNGDLHETNPPLGAPTIPTSLKLPSASSVASFKSTFNDIKKTIGDAAGGDPSAVKFLTKLGFDDNLFGALKSVSSALKMVAPAVIAIDLIFKLIDIISGTKPDPLKIYFDSMYNKLADLYISGRTQDSLQRLTDIKTDISQVSDDAIEYAKLLVRNPLDQSLNNRRSDLANRGMDEIGSAVRKILDSPWTSLVNGNNHSMLWAGISQYDESKIYESGSLAGEVPAIVKKPDGAVFDHRLMFPFVSHALLGYLGVIRAVEPKYRTKGRFRETLADLALRTEYLAENSLRRGIAKIKYKPSHFEGEYVSPENHFWNPSLKSYDQALFAVGAFDVVGHDDKFFDSGFPNSRKAGVDFGWDVTTVPYLVESQLKVVEEPFTRQSRAVQFFKMSNPEECARVANELSENAFQNLLIASGYFELVKFAACLRSHTAPPQISETVSVKRLFFGQADTARSNVVVNDRNNPLAPPVGSPASLSTQIFHAHITFVTDEFLSPLFRESSSQYSLSLRTLNTVPISNDELVTGYNLLYYSTDYAPDNSTIGGLVQINRHVPYMALGDVELVGARRVLDAPILIQKELMIGCRSFEWWVGYDGPNLSIDSRPLPFDLSDLAGTTSGARSELPRGVSIQNSPHAELIRRADWSTPRPDFVLSSSKIDWRGQPFNEAIVTAKLNAEIVWNDSNLSVRLDFDSEQPSFVIYLVIEELPDGSNCKIHTSVPIFVNTRHFAVPNTFINSFRRASRAPQGFSPWDQ